ncbi:hypothetical protein [Paludibacterium denitrificans]|nr:hypothetical protein [Paludibacterium denitrificans]
MFCNPREVTLSSNKAIRFMQADKRFRPTCPLPPHHHRNAPAG